MFHNCIYSSYFLILLGGLDKAGSLFYFETKAVPFLLTNTYIHNHYIYE